MINSPNAAPETATQEPAFGHEQWLAAHTAGLALKAAISSPALLQTGDLLIPEGAFAHESVSDIYKSGPKYHAYARLPIRDGRMFTVAIYGSTTSTDGIRLSTYEDERLGSGTQTGHTFLAHSGVQYELRGRTRGGMYELPQNVSSKRMREITAMARDALEFAKR